jgi:hypothetical protein
MNQEPTSPFFATQSRKSEKLLNDQCKKLITSHQFGKDPKIITLNMETSKWRIQNIDRVPAQL